MISFVTHCVGVLIVCLLVCYLVTCDGETQERVWCQTSPVSAVTRPTHFNFYHSGALVTYNDITPDLPQAELGDQSLYCLLICQLAGILASDWLLGSLVSPQAPCHRVMVSSGSRVTNIKTIMLGLYSRQIYTTWSFGHCSWSLGECVTTATDHSPWSGARRCSQARDSEPRVTVKCIIGNQPPPPRKMRQMI